jgi:hypothetical protein
VDLRIRASRVEFENYIIGIRRLMTDWRDVGTSGDAKKQLYAGGQDYLTQTKPPHGSDLPTFNTIKARNTGIPKLTGFLEKPIESEVAYDDIRKKAIAALQISNSDDLWGRNDIAFIKVGDVP